MSSSPRRSCGSRASRATPATTRAPTRRSSARSRSTRTTTVRCAQRPGCCSACTTSAARWPWRSAPARSSPRTGGTTARWPMPTSSWATTPALVAALGDVLDAAGHTDEAGRQYALVEYMGKVAAAAGTTYGRQLALFYADHDRRPEEALRLARLEAAGRGDIYTDDTLAWA